MAMNIENCDCGFVDANDPTQSIFTSFFRTNFSTITHEEFDRLFTPALYEVDRGGSAPFTRRFTADQINLADQGLELTVSPSQDSTSVPCSEVFTRANTFFYGAYHLQLRVGDVPGTVTAFFNYKNDSSEVDVEYLSAWDDPTLLYSVKPQIYTDTGNPDLSTLQRLPWNDSATSFDDEFHTWSFVWLPDIVHYGLDSTYYKTLTTNVPHAPGRLALSHWSDGNPKYSMGPPTQNSTVAIALLWAVYNDTSADALACQKTSSPCSMTDSIVQSSKSSQNSGSSGNSATIIGNSPTISVLSSPTSTLSSSSTSSSGGAGSSAASLTPAPFSWLLLLLVLVSWLRF